MTQGKKFKRRVRGRAEKTGERYSVARSHLHSEPGDGREPPAIPSETSPADWKAPGRLPPNDEIQMQQGGAGTTNTAEIQLPRSSGPEHEGTLSLGERSLVVFVDESGDPKLGDDHHPVFAWGGCVMTAGQYAVLRDAWREMKAKAFPQLAGPLHANRNRRSRRGGRSFEIVRRFFRDNAFVRVGIVGSRLTQFDPRCAPDAAIAGALQSALGRLQTSPRAEHVALVFESSRTRDDEVARMFTSFVARVEQSGVTVTAAFMDKQVCEPGLEIADFIAHATGCEARRRVNGGVDADGNFDAVFRSVAKGLVHFIDVRTIKDVRLGIMPAARLLRTALEGERTGPLPEFRDFPLGCSAEAALFLARFLVEQRCKPVDFIRVCRGERFGLTGTQIHTWLEVDDEHRTTTRVLDITADQFAEGAPSVWDPVPPTWHSTFAVTRRDLPDIEFLQRGDRLAVEDAYRRVRERAVNAYASPLPHPSSP